MTRAVLAAACALACALLPASAGAGSTGAQPSAGLASRLDRFLTEAAQRREFNGTVLVATGERVVLRKGYGFADVAARRPNRPSTRFRISSLTSSFTNVGLLQLHARGRLNLNRSVCAYVERCPRAWRPLTVRLLLTSPSGLPIILARDGPRSLDAWVDWLRRRPLRFAPGGPGRDRGEARILLAAHVLARVSGSSWISYLERNIFRPVGMRATGLDRAHPARATPYFRLRNRPFGRAASFPPVSTPDVGYGLSSTVEDIYRFERAVRTGRLVPRALLEEMTTATPPRTGSRIWFPTHVELGHGPHGTADGWYTALARDGPRDITILAFRNVGGTFLSDTLQRLQLITLGWPPRRTVADRALLERFTGRYQRRDTSQNRIVTTSVRLGPNGTLLLESDAPAHPRSPNAARRNARWRWILAPTANGAFYATGENLWWGVTVSLDQGATPAVDVLVIRFITFGGERRHRRVAPAAAPAATQGAGCDLRDHRLNVYNTTVATAVVRRLNERRAALGRPPLTIHPQLWMKAMWRAGRTAASGTILVVGPDPCPGDAEPLVHGRSYSRTVAPADILEHAQLTETGKLDVLLAPATRSIGLGIAYAFFHTSFVIYASAEVVPPLVNEPPAVSGETIRLARSLPRRDLSRALLANDRDDQGLVQVIQASAAHGRVELGWAGVRGLSVFYRPAARFSGRETLTYRVADAFGATTTGRATLVVPARRAPISRR